MSGPLNQPAPADYWRRAHLHMVDVRDRPVTTAGVARGMFFVSPDCIDAGQIEGMNVGVAYIPEGAIVAQAPHGAAGMAIADGLALNFPEIFGRWPLDGNLLLSRLDDVTALIQSLGGIPTID